MYCQRNKKAILQCSFANCSKYLIGMSANNAPLLESWNNIRCKPKRWLYFQLNIFSIDTIKLLHDKLIHIYIQNSSSNWLYLVLTIVLWDNGSLQVGVKLSALNITSSQVTRHKIMHIFREKTPLDYDAYTRGHQIQFETTPGNILVAKRFNFCSLSYWNVFTPL